MNDPGVAPREVAAGLPLAPGVYRFRDAAGRVLYLGRATSLRRRVVSYWGDLGDRAHLAPMVARVARVEAVVCDSAHEAAWLERNLLQASLPPWNRVRSGGQEVAVWIRLSESARAPGVQVVHQPAPGVRHFGPYLGGRKVRLAVSGLCRVLPLAYAGADPAGARGDIARVLGVSAAEPALTGFAVRGGYLTGWTQRGCGEASARRHLSKTPPEWAGFAQRNAELAARLAGSTGSAASAAV